MSLIIFRNLVTQKVCNDKECAVLSHLICAGNELSLEQLQDAFPTMRKNSLSSMLDSFYCRGWIELEERQLQGEEQPHWFASIDPVVIKRILERCNEGIDADLGKKVDVIRKIFEADEKQPVTDLSGNQTHKPLTIITTEPQDHSNLSAAQPQSVETNPTSSDKKNQIGDEVASPISSDDDDDSPQSCQNDPGVKRLIEENLKEIQERRKRRAFSVPSRERVIEEGFKYIDAAKDKYPHLADIDMEKAADTFIDFYESKGWKVGNQPMKDWVSALMRALREWKMPQREKTPQEEFSWLFANRPASTAQESDSDIIDAQFTEDVDDFQIGPSEYELEDYASRKEAYASRRGE